MLANSKTAITLAVFIRLSWNFQGMILATFRNGFLSFGLSRSIEKYEGWSGRNFARTWNLCIGYESTRVSIGKVWAKSRGSLGEVRTHFFAISYSLHTQSSIASTAPDIYLPNSKEFVEYTLLSTNHLLEL